MKKNYFNYLTKNFITELDFIPLKNNKGDFMLKDYYMGFEKRDILSHALIEVLDADVLSVQSINDYLHKKKLWLEQVSEYSDNADILCIEIFVFCDTPDSAKTAVIEDFTESTANINLRLLFSIVDLSNSDVFFSNSTSYIERVVEYYIYKGLKEDISNFEEINDIDKVIHDEKPYPVIEEVRKDSPATYFFLGLNILVHILAYLTIFIYGTDYMRSFGVKSVYDIIDGEYWRLITPIFLHADEMHLGANSFSLLIFGPVVERIFGTKKFILIYLLSGFLGNILSFAFSNVDSLGASGAILGIGGALVYIWTKNRKAFSTTSRQYLSLVFLVFFNIIYGFARPNIDNLGHIGGALGGFLAAGILSYNNDSSTKLQRINYLLAFIAVITLSVMLRFI